MIKRLYNKKISGLGLSIFRIVYTSVLLCEVIHFYYFRHLIFDKIPFLDPAEIDFGIPIKIWMTALIFSILGLFTRLTMINEHFHVGLFWDAMNNINLQEAKFIIKVNKIDTTPHHWKKGFFIKQMNKP